MSKPSSAPAVRYRPYRVGDEARILALYNTVFATARAPEQWRWEYRENPAGRLDIVVAETDAELVGHSAAVPLAMRHDGNELTVARIQNVFVHPRFQRRGIFAQSLLRLTRQLEAEGMDFVITFPNDNSLPGFMRTGEYVHLFDIFSLALPIARLHERDHAQTSIEIADAASLGPADAEFAARQLQGFAISTARTADYLAWRYHRGSGRAYRVLRMHQNRRQVGWAVAKAYAADRSLDLVEFLCVPETALVRAALVALTRDFASERLERINLWSMPHDPLHGRLLEIGFAREGGPTHVVYKALSARCSKKCGQPDAYYLAMGDSDVY